MTQTKKFFFTILYLSIIFITFEVSLRLIFPNFLKATNNDLYIEHKEYGWTLKKNLKYDYFNKYSRNSNLLETNDQGFRLINNKNNNENILFLGDSISIGLGVDGDKIFPSIVSSKLNYNGFNFSINGYSTDQLYIILDNVINLYKPKIVVYTFVKNDLEFNLKNFILSGNKKLGKPKLDKNLNIIPKPFFIKSDLKKVQKLKNFLNKNFATYRLMASVKEIISLYKKQNDGDFYYDLSFDYYLDAKRQNEIKFLMKILSKMKDICEKNNSTFILVKSFHLDDVKFASANNKNSKKFSKYKEFKNYFDKKINENKINYIQVSNFKNINIKNKIPFFNFKNIIYDGHYNELGHQTIAKKIINGINNF